MIWTEDLKLLTFHFCLFNGFLIINTFLKRNQQKKITAFQLNLSALSFIKLNVVFIEFSKTGNK